MQRRQSFEQRVNDIEFEEIGGFCRIERCGFSTNEVNESLLLSPTPYDRNMRLQLCRKLPSPTDPPKGMFVAGSSGPPFRINPDVLELLAIQQIIPEARDERLDQIRSHPVGKRQDRHRSEQVELAPGQ